jgi:hypothetical protein
MGRICLAVACVACLLVAATTATAHDTGRAKAAGKSTASEWEVREISARTAAQPLKPPADASSSYSDTEGRPPCTNCTAFEEEGGGGGSLCWEAQRQHDTQGPDFVGHGQLFQQSRWCSNDGGSTLNYRNTLSFTRVSGVCSVQRDAQHWRVGGGIGQDSADIYATADFKCNVGGGSPDVYETVWFVLRYYSWSGNPGWPSHH